MSDYKEIYKNGEQYQDNTAGEAIRRTLYCGKTNAVNGREFKRGEIYMTTKGFPCIVVSNENMSKHKSQSVVFLYDNEADADKYGIQTEVICKSKKYANCTKVQFLNSEYFTDYVRTATEKEMKAVDNALMNALGLKHDTGEAENLRNKYEAELEEEKNKRKAEVERADKLATKLVRANIECEKLKKELEKRESKQSKESLYKDMYEFLLGKMTGKDE